MRGALDLPKNGIKWQFFGIFSSACPLVYMDGVKRREVRGSLSRVGHRAGIGRVSAGREQPRSWLRYQLLYDRIRAAERAESQGSTDVPFTEGLTMAKKSRPAHFVARRGRSELVHPAR
jgi:hypothetical protein